MNPHLRLRNLHHSHYHIHYTYHQVIDEKRDYRRLHRYIRVGCARRRGGGILYWQAQLLVPLLYLSRSAPARPSLRNSFSCGTSCKPPINLSGLLFGSGLQGSYNAYSEKRGFRIPHGEVLVFALAYELTLLSLCSFLMSEKMRSDCVCVPFKPTYPPRVLQTLVCLEHHHVYLDAHIAIG